MGEMRLILFAVSALALAPTPVLAQHIDVGPGVVPGVGVGDGHSRGERRVIEEHRDGGHRQGGHREERREGRHGGGQHEERR